MAADLQSSLDAFNTAQHTAFRDAINQLDTLSATLALLHSQLSLPHQDVAANNNASRQLNHQMSDTRAAINKSFKSVYAQSTALSAAMTSPIDRLLPTLNALDETETLIPPLIVAQLQRDGHTDIAETYITESNNKELITDKRYERLHLIANKLESGDVSDAIGWAAEQDALVDSSIKHLSATTSLPTTSSDTYARAMIDDSMTPSSSAPMSVPSSSASDSIQQLSYLQQYHDALHSFHFDLHRIRYLQLLYNQTHGGSAALLYAQTHLGAFRESKKEEIPQLMSLLVPGMNMGAAMSTAPMGAQAVLPFIVDATNTFRRLWFQSSDLPTQSPLAVCVNASEQAIAQLIRFHSVQSQHADIMKIVKGAIATQFPLVPTGATAVSAAATSAFSLPSSSSSSSNSNTSVPIGTVSNGESLRDLSNADIDLDLNRALTFHPLIICPVIKEACTQDNPPVMLRCGHVISQMAMDNYVRNLRMTRRFKCPTCPKEQTPQETLVLHV